MTYLAQDSKCQGTGEVRMAPIPETHVYSCRGRPENLDMTRQPIQWEFCYVSCDKGVSIREKEEDDHRVCLVEAFRGHPGPPANPNLSAVQNLKGQPGNK